MEQRILSTILQFTSCTFLLFVALLWVRRNTNRPRIYFSIAYLVCGIDLLLRIFHVYNGTPLTFKALHPGYLYLALIEVPLFLLYLVEAVNPGWLTWRKIGLLCLPWLMWNICMLIPSLHFRELDTFRDIFRHIGETNVWLRLLFTLLILPYNILIYHVPYNWRRSSANRDLIRIYGSGFIILAVFFILSSVSGSILVCSLHLSYAIVLCFYLAYNELFLRLEIPREKAEIPDETEAAPPVAEMLAPFVYKSVEEKAQSEETLTGDLAPNNELWITLTDQIQKEKLWRNPDITQEYLASLLGISRLTLSMVIKENGFSGYKEYLNHYRIEDFLNIINRDSTIGIQEAFFNVGYRSRATALQYFHEYMGCTPTEYLNRIAENE